jgi:AraC family transcriptional regulator, transcriptional activator of pobA
MSTPAAFTLINPHNGHLAFKILPFDDNGHFDHIQRLNYYSVIFITEGEGELHADFSQYPFSAGSLMFFAPYQPFMLQTTGNINGFAVHFHPDFFCIHEHQKEVACHGVLFNNIYESPILSLPSTDVVEFLAIIDQMKREVLDRGLAQKELLVSYLKIFLIKATRLRHEQTDEIAAGAGENRKMDIIRGLRDAIESHYRARQTASDYAALLNVSPKVLARITRTYYHKTITNLIAERIIIEAKRELYMTSKTVKEIAYLLGFEDEYYFSRFFKINADVSPQLFRETVGYGRAEGSLFG